MKTEVKTVTPDMAREMLKNNQGNRTISPTRVNYFVSLMRSGAFQLTHQGICISSDGRLIDGQHRLQACVVSGIPMEVMVTTEADQKLFSVIDTGRNRTNSDLFKIAGYKYQTHLTSMCTKVLLWQNKYPLNVGILQALITFEDLESIAATNNDLFSEIFKSFERKDLKTNALPLYSLHFMYYLLNKIDYSLCEKYLFPLVNGMTEDRYIQSFRNEMIDLKIRKLRIDPQAFIHKFLHVIKCSHDDVKYRFSPEKTDVYAAYDEVKVLFRGKMI